MNVPYLPLVGHFFLIAECRFMHAFEERKAAPEVQRGGPAPANERGSLRLNENSIQPLMLSDRSFQRQFSMPKA